MAAPVPTLEEIVAREAAVGWHGAACLDAHPEYYDYIHSLRLKVAKGTFELVSGDGQKINCIYHGTFKIVAGNQLALHYTKSEDSYCDMRGSERFQPMDVDKVIDCTVTAGAVGFCDGYGHSAYDFTVTLSSSPFDIPLGGEEERNDRLPFLHMKDLAHFELVFYMGHSTTGSCSRKRWQCPLRSLETRTDDVLYMHNWVFADAIAAAPELVEELMAIEREKCEREQRTANAVPAPADP